jgi:hypothetical protein
MIISWLYYLSGVQNKIKQKTDKKMKKNKKNRKKINLKDFKKETKTINENEKKQDEKKQDEKKISKKKKKNLFLDEQKNIDIIGTVKKEEKKIINYPFYLKNVVKQNHNIALEKIFSIPTSREDYAISVDQDYIIISGNF